MYLLLIILMLIVSVLMCFIVLIQNSKGGGLASGFSSSNQIMGVRKTTDFLEKATWTLAAVMVVFSIVSAYTIPSSTGKGGHARRYRSSAIGSPCSCNSGRGSCSCSRGPCGRIR